MGFKKVQLKRGFNEIEPFFEMATKNNVVICGGYARYCASPLPTNKVVIPGDIDFFPKTEGSSDVLLGLLKNMGFEVKHENHVSVTMQPSKEKEKELSFYPVPQIIKPIIEGKIVTLGTTEEILENFDFSVVRAAIISKTEVLVDDNFEEDESHKKLRLMNIHCPISSLLRCCKYARKGYFMKPAEALKLFQDWVSRGTKYQERIIALFIESAKGKKKEDNPDGITQEEIDELEALLRID